MSADPHRRIADAMDIIEHYGGIDGGHHKQWVIDQVVRILLGSDYSAWIERMCNGIDGRRDTAMKHSPWPMVALIVLAILVVTA